MIYLMRCLILGKDISINSPLTTKGHSVVKILQLNDILTTNKYHEFIQFWLFF